MVYWPYGWTLVRPGSPLWGKWLGSWLPDPPVDPIGPMPWCSYMRAHIMHHSSRRGTWASHLKEGQRQLPAGELSQLEVCQLLVTGPQVAFPIGFNRCEEPVITSLLEPLANGISLTGGESIYLEIHILSSLAEEMDWKVPPIGEVSTTMIASPHKSTPWNQKERAAWPWRYSISYLKWCWTHLATGPKTQQRKPNPVVILTPPPHKPKELLQLVDTSSQVSTEMAEASLEGIPASISPIATISRSGSITPYRYSWALEKC